MTSKYFKENINWNIDRIASWKEEYGENYEKYDIGQLLLDIDNIAHGLNSMGKEINTLNDFAMNEEWRQNQIKLKHCLLELGSLIENFNKDKQIFNNNIKKLDFDDINYKIDEYQESINNKMDKCQESINDKMDKYQESLDKKLLLIGEHYDKMDSKPLILNKSVINIEYFIIFIMILVIIFI